MKTSERREAIISILKQAEEAIPAKALAAKFNVSRQAIVQDLTVIRAYTPGIASTSRGYVMIKEQENSPKKAFKARCA